MDNLQINVTFNLLDFAQFLASQPNADELKRQFDKAYHLARYEVKLNEKCQKRWARVSECPEMREDNG